MDKVLNIICVLWVGNFRGRDYNIDDVLRLKRMVLHNLKHRPFKFICLTNMSLNELDKQGDKNQEGIQWISLKYDLPGWWSKLEVFRDDLGIEDKCMFLDLDTIITGSLDEIAFYRDGLTFMEPIKPHPKKMTRKKTEDGKLIISRFQSSCFTWNHPEDSIFNLESFLEEMRESDVDVVLKYRGDQDLFGHLFDETAKTFPLEWFDKLRNCHRAKTKPDLKVVLGNPKWQWKRAKEGKIPWAKKAMNVSA